MSKYISEVEKVREKARKLLHDRRSEGKISDEAYLRLLEMNELLGGSLTKILMAGKELLKNYVIKDLADLFKFSPKPKSEEEHFLEMKRLIEGELGSKNAYIQRIAAEIASGASRRLGYPEDIHVSELYNGGLFLLPPKAAEELMDKSYSPLEELIESLESLLQRSEELGSTEEERQFIRSGVQSMLGFAHFLRHTREVIEDIVAWVYNNIKYVSEPGDWFKPALHTLIVGAGDCDCLAILICSLLRSIGFKTYLGFEPGHVFPGVIHAKFSKRGKIGELPPHVREDIKNRYGISDDYIIIGVDEVKVPLENIEPVNLNVGDLNIRIDRFTLSYMTDQELRTLEEAISLRKMKREGELRGLKGLIGTSNQNVISALEELELEKELQILEKAEKAIERYLECRKAKVYVID
jgi:ElaB/YqjD/DUF883 family membrane-anchored ribosome-binding protein